MYIYAYRCVHTCMYIYTYTYKYTCIYVYIFTGIRPVCVQCHSASRWRSGVCVCVCVCVYVYTFIYKYVYIFICIYTHTHTRTHTHTHTCTCTQAYDNEASEIVVPDVDSRKQVERVWNRRHTTMKLVYARVCVCGIDGIRKLNFCHMPSIPYSPDDSRKQVKRRFIVVCRLFHTPPSSTAV